MATVILPVQEPTITLIEGACFAISATTGDMVGSGVNGLYYRDTRILSTWRMLIDGRTPQPLAAHLDTPYQATFLGRASDKATSTLVERKRLVGDGLREDIVLRNLGTEDLSCRLTMEFAADFTDTFSLGSDTLPLG